MRKLHLILNKLSKFFNMNKESKVLKVFKFLHKVFESLLEVKVMRFQWFPQK